MKRIGFIDGRRVAGWHFPATAVPGNGQVVDVTDPSAGATGDVAAQTLRYRPTGDKTGAPYSIARTIEVYPEGDSFLLVGLRIYYHNPVDGDFNSWRALDIYMQPIGAVATVRETTGIVIGMFYDNATALPHSAFIHLYAHGAEPIPAAIRIGGSGAQWLFYFQRSVDPVVIGNVGGVQNRRIRVRLADIATDYFIPLHTA